MLVGTQATMSTGVSAASGFQEREWQYEQVLKQTEQSESTTNIKPKMLTSNQK